MDIRYDVAGYSGNFFIGRDKIFVKVRGSNIRHLPPHILAELEVVTNVYAHEGDVILATVINEDGSFTSMENQYSRQVKIHTNDIIMAVLGNRHSSTAEYGGIPEQLFLNDKLILDLLSDGGIVGKGLYVPEHRKNKHFTKLLILGAVSYKNSILNIKNLANTNKIENCKNIPPIILVGGTSSGAGKTTVSLSIIKALKNLQKKVGAVKLAGTGRLGDIMIMQDAGAFVCSDFPNYGIVSTYTSEEKVNQATQELLNDVGQKSIDVIVAELGGDIIEGNIKSILCHDIIQKNAVGIVHVSEDVIGLIGSKHIYSEFNIKTPIYFSLPKGRNKIGSKKRLLSYSIEAFDPLSVDEATRLVQVILGI